jgi:hypothetical protein
MLFPADSRRRIKPIPGYSPYYASDDGRVWRDGRPRSSRPHRNDYLMVTLSIRGRQFTRYIHRLVCAAFHGPCPSGMECRHLNNDRQDNRPENLEWATRADNLADKVKFGTVLRGVAIRCAILNERMVLEARSRAKAGERWDGIADQWGVKKKVLADAISGRRWAWLPGAVNKRKRRAGSAISKRLA